MSELKVFEKIIETIDGAILSQMFGKPSAKFNSKAFVAFYENEMVFKIGREVIPALLEKYPGSQNFDPSRKGRPMKDWLQVPFKYKNDWSKLAEEAMDFIS